MPDPEELAIAAHLGGTVIDQDNPATETAVEAPVVETKTEEVVEQQTEVKTENQEVKPDAETEKKPEDTAEVKTEEIKKEGETSDDSSFTFESNDSKPEEVVETKPEISVDEVIKEKTEGKWESIDALIEAATKPEVKFANGQIEKLNELALRDGDLTEWLRIQSVDFKEKSDRDVVKLKMKQQYPDWSDAEIEAEIGDTYFEGDDFDDKKNDRGARKMKADAATSRREFIKAQEDGLLPQIKEEAPIEVVDTAKAQQDHQKHVDAWNNNVKDSLKDYSEQTFKYGKDNSFTFNVDDSYKSKLESSMGDISQFYKRYLMDDGNMNFTKMKSEMILLDNWGDIMGKFHKEAADDGKEVIVKDQKNITINPKGAPVDTNTAKKSTSDHISDHVIKEAMKGEL